MVTDRNRAVYGPCDVGGSNTLGIVRLEPLSGFIFPTDAWVSPIDKDYPPAFGS